jgi:hypothetical protein
MKSDGQLYALSGENKIHCSATVPDSFLETNATTLAHSTLSNGCAILDRMILNFMKQCIDLSSDLSEKHFNNTPIRVPYLNSAA